MCACLMEKVIGKTVEEKTDFLLDESVSDQQSLNSCLQTEAFRQAEPLTKSKKSSGFSEAVAEFSEKIGNRLQFFKSIKLILESTWGDRDYIGLCGIQFLVGSDLAPLSNDISEGNGFHVEALPCRDMNAVGLTVGDPRVVENLFNDCNNTAADEMMWLVPFRKFGDHDQYVKVIFPSELPITGIRVWNYNKSLEGALRGCKNASLYCDEELRFRFILRPAPGWDGLSFDQTIIFEEAERILSNPIVPMKDSHQLSYKSPMVKQDYETLFQPSALLWTFTFFDNWNDHYYIGLDAIEFYDASGQKIDVLRHYGASVDAVPSSVRDLNINVIPGVHQGVNSDSRIPEALFAQDDCGDIPSCWLCPLSRCMTKEERAVAVNRLFPSEKYRNIVACDKQEKVFNFPKHNTLTVSFNYPVTVSAIRYRTDWYSSTFNVCDVL